MAQACTYSALTGLDTGDIEAVRAMLDGCLAVLLDPLLWKWAIALTIACGLIGAALGWIKGRPLAGLIWGLALGPIGWIVILLSKSKLPECPECGRPNSDRARTCRHCGIDFRKFARRTARSGLKDDHSSGGW